MSTNAEKKISVTAQGTCLMRAASYYERQLTYKSNDSVAPQLLPPVLSLMLRGRLTRALVKHLLFKAPGVYEYVIARTKYIDALFQNFDDSLAQVVILGAGLDSRAIRFAGRLRKAVVFELDAPATQQLKQARLSAAAIDLPANLRFVPIDFTQTSLNVVLASAGFDSARPSLFILEGLTYYLEQTAIQELFTALAAQAAPGSQIVFDCALHQAGLAEGQQGLTTETYYQELVNAGEKPGFILTEPVAAFLQPYGFTVREQQRAAVLVNTYVGAADAGAAARQFCLVRAEK